MIFSSKKPVSTAPVNPPTPCAAHTSSVSSILIFLVRKYTAPYVTTPAITPIAIAAIGPTKPDAGVIATRPHTTPVAADMADGLRFCAHDSVAHVSAEAAAAIFVTTNALAARAPAVRAEPALKPNHPNHNSTAPRITKGMLLAFSPRLDCFNLLPTKSAAASAEKPALMCTTVPPAKSKAPSVWSHPFGDHTQCAMGSYTSVAHSNVNTTNVLNLILSTNAPMMSAGVMAANIA